MNCLIFDFDFTLADATEGIVRCFNHAFGEVGMEQADREEVLVKFNASEEFEAFPSLAVCSSLTRAVTKIM